jgi:hypothetical protein
MMVSVEFCRNRKFGHCLFLFCHSFSYVCQQSAVEGTWQWQEAGESCEMQSFIIHTVYSILSAY